MLIKDFYHESNLLKKDKIYCIKPLPAVICAAVHKDHTENITAWGVEAFMGGHPDFAIHQRGDVQICPYLNVGAQILSNTNYQYN